MSEKNFILNLLIYFEPMNKFRNRIDVMIDLLLTFGDSTSSGTDN
jgi:hypothetical protein